MKTLRFGIEIETVGLSRRSSPSAIHSVVVGVVATSTADWRITDASGRRWQVVPDGSPSGGENSGEIVSPVLGYDDIDELQNVVRAVRTAGAKADPRRASTSTSTGALRRQERHEPGRWSTSRSASSSTRSGQRETQLSRYCRPIEAQLHPVALKRAARRRCRR